MSWCLPASTLQEKKEHCYCPVFLTRFREGSNQKQYDLGLRRFGEDGDVVAADLGDEVVVEEDVGDLEVVAEEAGHDAPVQELDALGHTDGGRHPLRPGELPPFRSF
jgi:hypothetical protein